MQADEMIKAVSELDMFQTGRGIGVRRHHDLGQEAYMGGTMVTIPLRKISLGCKLSTYLALEICFHSPEYNWIL